MNSMSVKTYSLTVKPSQIDDPYMFMVLKNNQICIFLCSTH